MTPYEQALSLASRPLKCGYVGCDYVYGTPPVALEDSLRAREAAQTFERVQVIHMKQAGHKQRRLALVQPTRITVLCFGNPGVGKVLPSIQ